VNLFSLTFRTNRRINIRTRTVQYEYVQSVHVQLPVLVHATWYWNLVMTPVSGSARVSTRRIPTIGSMVLVDLLLVEWYRTTEWYELVVWQDCTRLKRPRTVTYIRRLFQAGKLHVPSKMVSRHFPLLIILYLLCS
jgi:hypothetical protein